MMRNNFVLLNLLGIVFLFSQQISAKTDLRCINSALMTQGFIVM